MNESIRKLDDRVALLIVNHLSQELREEIPDDQQTGIQDVDEARQAVTAFLEAQGASVPQATGRHVASIPVAADQARALLQLFWEDETLRPRVEELLLHPPDYSQRSVEVALAAAIIFGGLISWLQTKVEIDVTRKDGKLDFHFNLKKDAASEALIEKVIDPIKTISSSV